MAAGGEIKQIVDSKRVMLRIGNEVEHCTLVYDIAADTIQVMVITISGGGMLTFAVPDFMNFLTPFLTKLGALRRRIYPE